MGMVFEFEGDYEDSRNLIVEFLDYLFGDEQTMLVERFLNNRKNRLNEKSSLVERFLYKNRKSNDNDIKTLFDTILNENKTDEKSNQVEELQKVYDDFVNTKDLVKNDLSVKNFIEYKEKQEKLFGMIMYHLTKIRINDMNKKAMTKIVLGLLSNKSFSDNVLSQDKNSYNKIKSIMTDIIKKLKE